ncbi:MAG: hypothetical protein NC102_09255 [Clostridium sp.]|nr:hypothetical protein [Clostridium sp.]
MATALDIFEELPREMRIYLRNYGWNFNRKACDYAVKRMRRKNPATGKSEAIEPMSKEQAEELLQKHSVKLERNEGYNFVYAINMAKAGYWKSSIDDERHLALFVKDAIDDPDNEGGNLFRKWLADCDAKGAVVDWEDLL